jgi:hypothetical protein
LTVLLALKLLLVPSLLAVISLAGRRWGPGVAGWLAGFPSLTGPILFFLALERGPAFTAQAAVLCLSCVFPAISFGVAYAWASRRFGWAGALACAFPLWFLAAFLLSLAPLTALAALVLAVATLLVARRAYPRAQGEWGSRVLPATELAARMLAGAVMVLAVTSAAEALGPIWTGLFSAFPVMSTVLASFSHRANGSGYVIALLRSMVGGFYSFIAFCLAVALLLPSWGVAPTFVCAVLLAVTVQGAVRFIVR